MQSAAHRKNYLHKPRYILIGKKCFLAAELHKMKKDCGLKVYFHIISCSEKEVQTETQLRKNVT